jgi:membrane-associated protease RseP (regulator of RpoE activity)
MHRERRTKLPVAVGGLIGLLLGVAHVALPDAGFSLADFFIAAVVLAVVVQPVTTLGHELGHAVAALMLGARPTLIIVGRGPFLRVRAEPTLILFSVLPTRGVPFAGVCRYDPAGLAWSSVALIALAGPLATLLELLAVVLLGPAAWGSGALTRMLTVETGLYLAIGLVVTLWPRGAAMRTGSNQAFRHDGDLARYAYARHRATMPAI